MEAVEILRPGSPEVLALCQRPMPEAGTGEVVVKVHAAGINRPDILQRTGHYPVPPGASDIPGLEIAGEIVAGDCAGSDFKIGDLVCALTAGGGYAQFCVVPVVQCLPIPSGLSALEGASLPETFFTVWSNVCDRGRLSAGETLLVQGGSSGIGVAAIQLATALGHKVFATAGSPEKCKACESLGAVRAINYKTEDFLEITKLATGGRGVDVILDMVGGDYLPRELDTLADDGRIVLIALLGGAKVELNLGGILRRRLSITGSTLRARSVAFKGAIATNLRNTVWPLIEAGKIKPVIFKTFPLHQAAEAHAMMESGSHIGKIVLTVS
jgi:NADPH2:quinone reductase